MYYTTTAGSLSLPPRAGVRGWGGSCSTAEWCQGRKWGGCQLSGVTSGRKAQPSYLEPQLTVEPVLGQFLHDVVRMIAHHVHA